jgi:Ca2+-transporting ATPase
LDQAKDLASKGLRVLAFACAPHHPSPELELQDQVLIGLMAQLDPARPEVALAVSRCRDAGIRPVMITGDHPLTAKAIGTGIGTGSDVRSAYTREVAIASDANALADRMNRMLLFGQMSSTLRARIVESVNSVAIPAATGTNQSAIDTALLNRSKLAVYMTMVSPEYLVQR